MTSPLAVSNEPDKPAARTRRPIERPRLLLGVAAIGCYAVHAIFHLVHGSPADLLWMCHLGAAIVGAGLLFSSMTTAAIGTLFLCLGTPLWFVDLAGGGEFYPTSCFTHIGGLVIGLYASRRYGLPSGAWWRATLGLVFLILVCRFVTPPKANVNLAFAMYPGWERVFSSYLPYISTMVAIAALYFLIAELILRRLLVGKRVTKGEQ
jgi:hypothetical protein